MPRVHPARSEYDGKYEGSGAGNDGGQDGEVSVVPPLVAVAGLAVVLALVLAQLVRKEYARHRGRRESNPGMPPLVFSPLILRRLEHSRKGF